MKSIKLFLLISIIAFMSGCNNGAKLDIREKKIYLRIKNNLPYKYFDITLQNVGNKKLEIYNIKPSCKCIILKVEDTLIINPNASRKVTVKFMNDEKTDATERIVIVSNSKSKIEFLTINKKVLE